MHLNRGREQQTYLLPVARLTRWRDYRRIRRVLSHAVRACDIPLNMQATAKQRRYNRAESKNNKDGNSK